jgi:hypothetical protein
LADVLPGYTWNPASQRYRSGATGRFVARRDVLGLLDGQVNSAGQRLGDLTTALHEGRIAPGPWADQMQSELRRLHSQNRALAVGGWDRMTPRDWGAVGGRLRDDYARVVRLAQEVQAGTVSLPQALNRVNGYIGNARVQFWNAERDNLPRRPGMVWLDKRNLGIAEHCGDCIDYDARGWSSEGVLPPPGMDSECTTHCRCTMEHREVPAEEAGEWLGTRRR